MRRCDNLMSKIIKGQNTEYNCDNIIYINGRDSIICKGTYLDESGQNMSCVLKFKKKENYNYKSYDNINHEYIANIIEIIEDLNNFGKEIEYHSENIIINKYNGYFCIVEQFVEGDTLEKFCLKFNNIDLIHEIGNNRLLECYYQYEQNIQEICIKCLNNKFYNDFQIQIYNFIIQIVDIFNILSEKNITYSVIKPDDIIIGTDNKLYLIGLYKAEAKNEESQKNTIASLGNIFKFCMNIFDYFTDAEYAEENAKQIINDHNFNIETLAISSNSHYNCYDKSLKKFINKCIKKKYNSYSNLKKALKKSQKLFKKRKSVIVFFIIFIVLILGASSYLLIKDKNDNPKDVELSLSCTEIPKGTTINTEEIINQAKDILERYINNKLSYEEAQNEFGLLTKIDGEEMVKILETFNNFYNSKINYIKGEETFNSGQFKDARIAYKEAEKFYNMTDNVNSDYYENIKKNIELSIYSQKQKAEEIYRSGNYKEAYSEIKSLAEEFPEENEFIEIQNKYIKDWIENQRQQQRYFQEDGAVTIAYEYNFFDVNGGIEELKQEGYYFESEQLINIINQERSNRGFQPLINNERLKTIAIKCAEALRNDPYHDFNGEVRYNINPFSACSADEAKNKDDVYLYLSIKDNIGEILENSKTIGVGICYDENKKTCSWAVLTAEETEIF